MSATDISGLIDPLWTDRGVRQVSATDISGLTDRGWIDGVRQVSATVNSGLIDPLGTIYRTKAKAP